jgi:hypothetical protein
MTTPTLTQPTVLEPTWEVAQLFPPQGEWSDEDYLALTRDSKRLIELNQGYLEVLPMPTRRHQGMVTYLYNALLPIRLYR